MNPSTAPNHHLTTGTDFSTDPHQVDLSNANQGQSARHLLGTESLGRDILARVLIGGRFSLAVGFAAALIAVLIGSVVGGVAGLYRRLDGPFRQLTDVFLALPTFPMLLLVVMLYRLELYRFEAGSYSVRLGFSILVALVIGVTNWMWTARVVRSHVLVLRQGDSESAEAHQEMPGIRYIVRRTARPATATALMALSDAVLAESSLSFLGLGSPIDLVSWGIQARAGLSYAYINPWHFSVPCVLVSLTVLSANLVVDGLGASCEDNVTTRDLDSTVER